MDVIAVDFDGTLSLGEFPQCGPANKRLIEILKRMMSPNPDYPKCTWFVLWTSRAGIYLEEAVHWLKSQGLAFDSVNGIPPGVKSFPDTARKLFADVYIDDKAISPIEFIKRYCDK